MAEFDLEQLKTLFENLGDRLDKTQGDKLSREELVRIRAVMDKMAKTIDDDRKQSKGETREFITQFWNEWRAQDPMGPVVSRLDRQPRGTIIQEEKAKRQQGQNNVQQDKRQADLASKGFIAGMNNMKKSTDKASSGLDGFTKSLKQNSLIAGTVAAGKGLLSAITDQAEAYRTLKSAGDGQVGSIQEMNNAAINAHMTIQEFAENLKKGSAGLKQFGGFKFANLTGALTKSTNTIGNMALNFNQRNEAIDNYLQIQSSSGTLRQLSQEQMVSGIQRLVRSSEETASILGMTREEALKAQAEQARDHNMNAVIRAMNLDADSVRGASTTAKNAFGDVGESLLKQLIAGVAPQGDAATLAATDPEAYKLLSGLADQLKSGGAVDQKSIAKQFQNYADANRNSDLTLYKAQLGIAGSTPYTGVFGASTQAQDQAASFNTDAMVNKNGDAGTNEALRMEESARAATAAFQSAIVAVTNSILTDYAPAMKTLNDAVQNASDAFINFTLGLQNFPTLMGGIGGAIIAAGLALTGFIAAAKVARGAMFAFRGLRALTGLGGAARGAGGAARSGGTILGRLLGGGAAAGEGAGAAAGGGLLATGAALLGGLALGVGGAYGAVNAGGGLKGRSGESFLGTKQGEQGLMGSRGSRYLGAAASGAAGGALIGSAVPIIGTAIGGAVGGLAGLGYAWWNDPGSNGQKKAPATARPIQHPATAPVHNPANASAATPRNQMSPATVNQKLLEANDRSANYLKGLKENSDKQLDLMREEIMLMRTANDRVTRLLEEGNRNTKAIADSSG